MDPYSLQTQSIHLCLCRLFIVEQVYSDVSQSQGQICTLLLELLQNEAAWHVLTTKPGAAASTECGRGFIYTSGEVGI